MKLRKFVALLCLICFMLPVCLTGLAADTELAVNPALDPSKYEGISEVCDFTSCELRLDEDNALKLLLGDDISLERVDASGNWFVSGSANEQKHICVFDNGEHFGIKNSGFNGA